MSMHSTLPPKDIVLFLLDKKEDLTICNLQETHLIEKKKHWLRVKGWKNI
jgi:hypothetical protein